MNALSPLISDMSLFTFRSTVFNILFKKKGQRGILLDECWEAIIDK